MKLRAVIVDDELLALRRLEIALESIPDVDIVGKARAASEARKLIASQKPDLLLVDVQMPGESGLELVESITSSEPPEVILITAYEQFAIQAFEQGAIGYVLKPIDGGRLAKAIGRARAVREGIGHKRQLEDLQAVVRKLRSSRPAQHNEQNETDLWITHKGAAVRLSMNEVRYFEAAGDYVEVVTGAASLLHYDSLRSLEGRIDQTRFMRVHRSSIVALPFVTSYQSVRYGGLVLSVDNGDEVRCSRAKSAELKRRLKSVMGH